MAKTVWEVIRMTRMADEAKRVKNFDRAPYTETELKELSKEELQGLYLGFYGKESCRLREAGLIKAILEVESELKADEAATNANEEEKTMTRMSTHELMEALETVKTREEAEVLLNGATVKMLRAVRKEQELGCGDWSRARKSQLIDLIVDYYVPVESEESAEKETETMVKTNEVTTEKTKTLSELQDRVEVLKGRYELYCQRVKTAKYHLRDVKSKENRRCYEVMKARDEYKNARYERFRTYIEYCKTESELRSATGIRKESETMTKKQGNVQAAIEKMNDQDSLEGIRALLKDCTKSELHEVYENITCRICEIAPTDWKRSELVNYYAGRLMAYKESEKQNAEMAKNFIENERPDPENTVQRVMTEIKNVGYEAKAMREILKLQTLNFQQAMLQIMDGGHGSMFDEYLRISDLTLCVRGMKDPETRQRYIENAAMCIKLGRKNIEFFRNNERFQEYIPINEEWQKYYQEWLEYLESYESKKELSA